MKEIILNKKRTKKVILKELAFAEKTLEGFRKTLREESDKDYKEGLYINIENVNKHITELNEELECLQK